MMTNNRMPRAALVVWALLVSMLLLLPTLVVIPVGFTSSRTLEFPTPGFSTQWYEKFFTDPEWLEATGTSFVIAVISAILATALGTALAIALDRGRGSWRAPVRALAMGPMVLPGIIIAIGIYGLFLQWRIDMTFIGFVLAHSILAIPFVLVSVSDSLRMVDRNLERAASSLGAPAWRVFTRVLFPAIRPGVLTGLFFAAIISFDEAIVSLFLSGPDLKTLPVLMYQSVSAEIDPTIAAVSSMLIGVSVVLLAAVAVLGKAGEGKSKKHG